MLVVAPRDDFLKARAKPEACLLGAGEAGAVLTNGARKGEACLLG
jgi:hypothetical protein